ncbi:enolase C-terminal domain-like protein [Amycolatopsis palatopharyngis]|uniref:enolase C-terminal domain-like protein n=1 Tax=Amycolatopsis palatopharyngis TaxID=187982 RepID=UPI000E2283C7|nr:enolase C-terminal domain-like protein [Amycolatopsis palatopharyngis]
MRITDVRVAEAPLEAAMSNAVIDFSTMTVSMVAVYTDAVVDGDPVVGYGFHSNGRYAQTGLLTERLLPRLEAAADADLIDPGTGVIDPVLVRNVLMANEKPGGHGDRAVAVATLDMAMWDAAGKAKGQPLHHALRDRFLPGTQPAESVWVYAAGGYYRDDDGSGLRQEIELYLELGYRDVKIKIGGAPLAEDLRRIESVLAILPEGCRLAVDANGRFDMATALRYGAALESYDLVWYEEPCDPLDYRCLAVLAEEYPGVLATGENLFSAQDVRNLLRYGGLRPDRDVLQMDPALSYGVSEYAAMVDQLIRHGWRPQQCCPHGGHQYNLAITAAFGLGGCESYPRVFEPFGGFADETPVVDGRVRLPEAPGIGVEHKRTLHELVRQTFS